MLRRFALSLLLCLPLPALAQPPPPATAPAAAADAIAPASDPARRMLDAWLEAFNSNDRAQLEAFRDRDMPKLDVDGMLGFRAQTGGFHLLRREPSAPGAAQALVQENDSETVARLSVALRATVIAAIVLAGAALIGDWLLRTLSITLPAFRIAGGLLLFSIASEMVFGVRIERQTQRDECD